MDLAELTTALGYRQSPLYREDDGDGLVALSDKHWIRSARKAGVTGSYYFKTSPEPNAVRPAVHVAQADTVEDARTIHRTLWNQGVNPFLIVLLPGQVRVFTGFAFDPAAHETGAVTPSISTDQSIPQIIEALSAFTADSIDRGEIWQKNAQYLGTEQRVDTTLLRHLKDLSAKLADDHGLPAKTCHSLIGKFVYLAYLRARDIVSDKWLREEASVDPMNLFEGNTFASTVTLDGFRKLAKAVETRFNGKLFPIPWGSSRAPRADAVRMVARVFAGEEISGQMHLSFQAYDFASIPVEFLSSIYEQFIHSGDEDKDLTDGAQAEMGSDAADPEKRGAHYTPEPLADYLVSEINAVRNFKLGMKILDPCCGSGVFLVVAFRRLVELECLRQKRTSLNASELRDLLETSIYAVERNIIACQIAGFSLILAMLSYVEPPELHQRKKFRFPTLVGNNLFPEDFFNDQGRFWQQIVSPKGKGIKFDCIVGNPPWVEADSESDEAQYFKKWYNTHKTEYSLARNRTGEAFAWRVLSCLSGNGTVGLILHAKTLTNDQLEAWRRKFFCNVQVRRVTNFSNMKYVLFASGRHPCFSIVFERPTEATLTKDIIHFGPFVANQSVIGVPTRKKRRAWAIGLTESEIKTIQVSEIRTGSAMVWKMALWGNQRDVKTIQRLCNVFSTTLGKFAKDNNWTLSLGLQLRDNQGSKRDPNEELKDSDGRNILDGLKVLDHAALVKTKGTLSIKPNLLIQNTHGCFVRKGRHAGLAAINGPRLFLWNNFAAYTDEQFIIRHDKLCLAGGSEIEMKAVAAIWSSNFASYLRFFVTSAAWGIGYSHIDKGDAENMPFPRLTSHNISDLSKAWDESHQLEKNGLDFPSVQRVLDDHVASTFGISIGTKMMVRDFFDVRFALNEGKNPPWLRTPPSHTEMLVYGTRLRDDLDAFLGGKAHHLIKIFPSCEATSITVTLKKIGGQISPIVGTESASNLREVESLLKIAEIRFSQWVYVKRSIRIFDGDSIHIIKPSRLLEWTETQAMMDADDIIAEVLEERQQRKS